MQLNTLKPAPGSIKSGKRVGRGQGSGKGGTSTRGHNGAQSRSGYKTKRGFEGGQLPLQRRLPRFGFKNPNRVAYKPISLSMLQNLVDQHQLTKIDQEVLVQHGLVHKRSVYKILGKEGLTTPVEVATHAISEGAREVIERLGGQVSLISTHA